MAKNKENETTSTQVKVKWDIWAKFTAIITLQKKSKHNAFTDALNDYNQKHKEVLR